ncbi:hypothetical protein HC766_04085 [Candidatus Gracilibacteria bacterium]|nr:hypothetical protein [Thermales bacterium]NJL97050.1 hypothetical protein [Candidatus Gracilibacteria bacterium]NJS41508.1 hypothetical protein [Candidatus Gracilibacteria bacterium]
MAKATVVEETVQEVVEDNIQDVEQTPIDEKPSIKTLSKLYGAIPFFKENVLVGEKRYHVLVLKANLGSVNPDRVINRINKYIGVDADNITSTLAKVQKKTVPVLNLCVPTGRAYGAIKSFYRTHFEKNVGGITLDELSSIYPQEPSDWGWGLGLTVDQMVQYEQKIRRDSEELETIQREVSFVQLQDEVPNQAALDLRNATIVFLKDVESGEFQARIGFKPIALKQGGFF